MRCVATLLALFLSGSASAGEAGGTLAPYFVVSGGGAGVDRLPLLDTSVEASVAGVIADVRVRQTYVNRGERPLDATYVFPASTRAAVHGLTMTVGERRIRARIEEREQARARFERAKAERKTATLLEQERPNVFRTSVANVMPGDRIEVELHYSELLVPEDGLYELVFPTVVGPRYAPGSASPGEDGFVASPYEHECVAPPSTLHLRARVAAGAPIDGLVSPTHAISEAWSDPGVVEITLAPSETNGGDRDFVLQYRLAGEKVRSGLLLLGGEEEGFFLLTVQPPRRVVPQRIPRRDYVFIVDVSGSMNGFPLDTARRLLRSLVADLRPTDTFDLLLFSGDSRLLAPEPLAATPQNVERALRFLDEQEGGGGTELLDAVKEAMALPSSPGTSRNLVIVTDGFVSAEREAFTYVRDHLGDASFFAFGIGSSVNRYLIEGIAKAGRAEPFVVLAPADSDAVADRFRAYVRSPVLTGVRVEMQGFDARDVEPRSIPDVLADRPVLVYGKWRGAPSGRIVVRGTTGEGPFEQVIDVARVRPDPSNAALRYLWARERAASISDFAFGQETTGERDELVQLGLRYELLTKYTSFVAVQQEVRPGTGAPVDVQQPLPLPQGVSDLAVGSGPEPPLWMLAALLGALVAARRLRAVRA
jgi:Ca-activated chloride channel family protein